MVRLARLTLLCLLALAASMALAEPSEPSPEQSVRSGVNDKYLAPDLDVDEWTKRFEGEAREIFVRRREIVE